MEERKAACSLQLEDHDPMAGGTRIRLQEWAGKQSPPPPPPIGSVGKSWSGGKQDQVIAPRGQNSWGEKGKREFFMVDNAQGGWSVGK